jgi:hypothetical protein
VPRRADQGRARQDAGHGSFLDFSPTQSVVWTHEDTVDTHWDRAVEVLDSTLAGALQKFIATLT